jgi:hypothetical protein
MSVDYKDPKASGHLQSSLEIPRFTLQEAVR